jgi:hypothetical protein
MADTSKGVMKMGEVIRSGTVHFIVQGEFITDLARNFWLEGSLNKAFELLDQISPMTEAMALKILSGKLQIVGYSICEDHECSQCKGLEPMDMIPDDADMPSIHERLAKLLESKNERISDLETTIGEMVEDDLEELEWEESGNYPLTMEERAARRELRRRIMAQKKALGDEFERVLEEGTNIQRVKAFVNQQKTMYECPECGIFTMSMMGEDCPCGGNLIIPVGDEEDHRDAALAQMEAELERLEKRKEGAFFLPPMTPEELEKTGLPEDPSIAWNRVRAKEMELDEEWPEPDDFNHSGGWLSPGGDWYSCHWMEHQPYARALCDKYGYIKEDDRDGWHKDPQKTLEEKGWMKVLAPGESTFNTTKKSSIMWQPKKGSSVERAGPTRKQQEAIWDWQKKHNIESFQFNWKVMDYRGFLEHIEKEKGEL